MKTIVLKFGGTSVGSVDRIKKVTNIIISYVKKRYKVIVVTSAMSGATNDLVKKSKKISNNFISSEYDVLVSSGEQISCALIAGRLNHLGYRSQSWMGWQVPILTDGNHGSSRISAINKKKINKFLLSGGIPIIAGFQGVNLNNRITTLGRGGSDASAVMCAKFFKAQKIEKRIFLQTIDLNWKSHIQYLEQLRQVIGLRSYGQRDPLIEYKKEAFTLFENLLNKLKTDLITILINLTVIQKKEEEIDSPSIKKNINISNNPKCLLLQKKNQKISRNERCDATGKKFKQCCGAL